jgi:hypothetical protein
MMGRLDPLHWTVYSDKYPICRQAQRLSDGRCGPDLNDRICRENWMFLANGAHVHRDRLSDRPHPSAFDLGPVVETEASGSATSCCRSSGEMPESATPLRQFSPPW